MAFDNAPQIDKMVPVPVLTQSRRLFTKGTDPLGVQIKGIKNNRLCFAAKGVEDLQWERVLEGLHQNEEKIPRV